MLCFRRSGQADVFRPGRRWFSFLLQTTIPIPPMLQARTIVSSSRLALAPVLRRHAGTAATTERSGSIADVFASLSGGPGDALPSRFSTLKKELWHPALEQRWKDVLKELKVETDRIVERRKKGDEVSAPRTGPTPGGPAVSSSLRLPTDHQHSNRLFRGCRFSRSRTATSTPS